MKWVTRERARVDRIACPWLIARFIDPTAEFLFVPAAEVARVAARERATPFDVPDAEIGHHGPACSFDALLAKYRLSDPALQRLAAIVRGADTAARWLTPESPGLYAVATGFRAIAVDDYDNMARQFPAYDALYAYCRGEIEAARRALQASERVTRWQAAWESRDAEQVAALYEPTATHQSALVARLSPEAGGTVLQGVAAIREYARRGLARFTALRFELLTVTETAERAAVEYHRHSNLDSKRPAHVLELIEWHGELIAAVRVFHA